MIASLKKQISELENAITNTPKDATAEQLLGLKIALKGANSKLESYNKTLSDISNIRDTATKNIEALNLNKDDKEAAQQARTLLSNLTNPEEAKRLIIIVMVMDLKILKIK
jgi:chromosome segregation ATPase